MREAHQTTKGLSPVRVRSVGTFLDRRRFIAFPYALYDSSPYWVAPLRRHQAQSLFSRKNPFFRHSRIEPFIAEDAAGRVVGRIAAIVNGMHLKRHGDGAGFFGFFECVERYDVAAALFDAVAVFLRAQGSSLMRGPANPSINECSGLLVEGFDRAPAIMMPYNPPYYEDFLLRYNFERRMTMAAYYGAWKHLKTEHLRRGVEVVEQRTGGLTVRHPDMSRFTEEAKTMCEIYNQAFDDGWGHTPMTQAEFLFMAKAMRTFLDPNLLFFLEHHGIPIGFSLSLPDINALLRHLPDGRLFPFGFLKLLGHALFGELRECRTAVLALLPAYRRRGLDSLLILKTIESAQRHGYVGGELSWVMDDNRVLQNALHKLGAVRDKQYALFETRL